MHLWHMMRVSSNVVTEFTDPPFRLVPSPTAAHRVISCVQSALYIKSMLIMGVQITSDREAQCGQGPMYGAAASGPDQATCLR
jgi:hypothetical protein